MLAPISWRVPPRHYGPWELVVSLLTEGLVERGVDVTLFATADSVTSARLDAVCPRPLMEDPTLDAKVWEALHLANAFEHAGALDLVHNHYDFLPLTYSRLISTPLVTTIHGFSSDRIRTVYRRYDDRVAYVSISDADRDPDLSYAAAVRPLDDRSDGLWDAGDRPPSRVGARGDRRGRHRLRRRRRRRRDRGGRSRPLPRPARRAHAGRRTIQPGSDGGRLPPRLRAGSRGRPRRVSGSFRVGVNYWPAATAMRWWRRFDREQVSRDFAEIPAAGRGHDR